MIKKLDRTNYTPTASPDVWVDLSFINQGKLDHINELKQEMQELMPLVYLLRPEYSPDSLPYLERQQKLRIMGYSAEEIETMCGWSKVIKETT